MPDDLDAYLVSPEAIHETDSAAGRLLEPGAVISGLRVVAFLGRGATSEVWRVRDDALKRDVALKMLTDPGDDLKRERFLAEARLLAQFDNPGIVHVHALEENAPHPYFTMDLLRPIPEVPSKRMIRRIFHDVLDGLAFLHGKGVVHRDIKPSNVLLNDSGHAVLTDLGIAHVGDEALSNTIQPTTAHNMTLAGGHVVALGTPGFSAPEQFTGGEVSPTADIHALGALLLALFKGKPPLMWRGLIRCMTSSTPALRLKSVQEVKAHLRLIGILHGLAKTTVIVLFCLAAWGAFCLCRPNWTDLQPDCIQRFADRPEVVIKLPGTGHYFLPSLMLSPVLSSDAERIGPKIKKMPDGTVDIGYPLDLLKKESSWRRRVVKIVGHGTLKCPTITYAEVHIQSGVTLITSGRYEIDNSSIPHQYPPQDSCLTNNIGYAAYIVEAGAKLTFTDNKNYPPSLISIIK